MRTLTAGILIVALGISACNRSTAANEDGKSAAPAAAALTVPRNADDVAPAAAPAAAVGMAAAPARANAAAPDSTPTIDWREVTIPAGTSLPIVLETAVASDATEVEAPVSAHIARSIRVNGVVVVPQGSGVSGVVTEARRAPKVKGLAHIAIKFDTLTPRGDDQRYPIKASPVARSATPTKKNDAVKILGPAVGGAIIGRIAGGRKGAAIGAGAGAGGGAAVVMATRGKEVQLGRGAAFTLRLIEPLTVRVKN